MFLLRTKFIKNNFIYSGIIKKGKMKREEIKEITLTRTIEQTVTFCEWDFETIEEFDEFVSKVKSDEDFRFDLFEDNLSDEHYKVIQDVIKNLGLDNPEIVKHSVDRSNLYLEIIRKLASSPIKFKTKP